MSVNIILANATIRSGNKGCTALCLSTLSLIDKVFKDKGVDYSIFLPDSGLRTSGTQSYQVGELFEAHFYSCEYAPNNIKSFLKSLLHLKKAYASWCIFKDADYILDIGQGDSFADIYGKKRFDKIDRIHQLARFLNKRYCFLPQTIGPFKDSEVQKKAVHSLKDASLVMARDKLSYDYVLQQVPEQKHIGEYIDVAFFLPYEKITFEKDFVHVGLNISGLLWNGGYTKDNQFGLKDNYQHLVLTIIDYFIGLKNVKVHLIGHVMVGEKGFENDYVVNYDLWKKYNCSQVILAPFGFGPIELKSYIAGMDFFLGARMHSTIAAFSSGVPVVPMAYSRKFNGLFQDTLQYPYLVDLKTQTKDEMLIHISEAFGKRNTIKTLINDRMNSTVKEKEEKLIQDLSTFFNL